MPLQIFFPHKSSIFAQFARNGGIAPAPLWGPSLSVPPSTSPATP